MKLDPDDFRTAKKLRYFLQKSIALGLDNHDWVYRPGEGINVNVPEFVGSLVSKHLLDYNKPAFVPRFVDFAGKVQ